MICGRFPTLFLTRAWVGDNIRRSSVGINRLPTLVASSSSSSASSDEGAGEEDVVEKMVDVGVAADALNTMSA